MSQLAVQSYALPSFCHQMEAAEREQYIEDEDQAVAPPNGGVNEMLDVGQEGEVSSDQDQYKRCFFLDVERC